MSAALTILLAAEAFVFAETSDVKMTTQIRSVAVFKNGIGYFLRDGKAEVTDGWAQTDMLPPAALGTFWAGSPQPGVRIEQLISSREEVAGTEPVNSIQDLLGANVGKRITFTSGTKPVTARLISISPSLALMQTDSGTIGINPSCIGSVEVEGQAEVHSKSKSLRFKIAGGKGKVPITIGYLQKGIIWTPAYQVDLQNEKSARITMQAILANDAADIESAYIYFAVGYPNFMYSDYVTPLALTQTVTEFVQSMSRPYTPQYTGGSMYMGQMMFSNAAVYNQTAPADAGFGYATAQGTPGAQEEDLFLYRMKDVSLKKGERGYYTLFSAEVPYEHVYEWVVPDTSVAALNENSRSSSEPQPTTDRIWHKLRISNTSGYPWTSAPAMTVSNGKPLAQDMLEYTPKSAKSTLKITVATDIKGSASETERSREDDTTRSPRAHKITVLGKLTLRSFKTANVTVNVRKMITGEVVSAGEEGRSEKTAVVLSSNPSSKISWDVALKPGEEKTLTYSYVVYKEY